jgi:hypothetical protein
MLCVINEFTRECLAIRVERKLHSPPHLKPYVLELCAALLGEGGMNVPINQPPVLPDKVDLLCWADRPRYSRRFA